MPESVTNRSVIVTTSLTLVVFTTVVFGSSIGVLGKLLFGKGDADKDKATVNQDTSVSQLTDAVSSESHDSDTKREKLIHYNESLSKSQIFKSNAKATCVEYMTRFDEYILRPILIHNYDKEEHAQARQLYEVLRDNGTIIDKFYAKQMLNEVGDVIQDKEKDPAFAIDDARSGRSKVSGMTGNSKNNVASIANLARRISLRKNRAKDNLEKGKWVWNSGQ
jgi:hypothetical protein